jgi:preprotein translocase subunit SecA
MGIEVIEDHKGIFKRLMAELEKVPPEVLPPDEREDAANAWAVGAAQKGYKTIEEILSDRRLKALLLDDFDDEAADERLELAMAAFKTSSRPVLGPATSFAKVGRNERCPCGSGKKYKNCCLVSC